MTNSFSKKTIRVTITLADGKTFGSTGKNTLILQGLRTLIDVQNAGAMMPSASVKIYNMLESDMNQLTRVQWNLAGNVLNILEIEAGDFGGELQKVYSGNISFAYADYSSAPDVCFVIDSMAALYEKLAPAQPISYKGSTDVAAMMGALATEMGFGFENHGVDVKIDTPYYCGTKLEQAISIAKDANIEMTLDDNIMHIVPRTGARQGDTPLITPKTGLIGYPTVDNNGINFKCLFNNNIKLMSTVALETDIKMATGTWKVFSVTHQLEAETPNGAWFTVCKAGMKDQVKVAGQ